MSFLSWFILFLLFVGFVGAAFMTWPLWLSLPKFKLGAPARFFDFYPDARAIVATPDMFVSIAQQLARTFYHDPTYGQFFHESQWKGQLLTWFFYIDLRFRTYANGGKVYHLSPGGATALFLDNENWKEGFLASLLGFPCLVALCGFSPFRVLGYLDMHRRMEALHPQTPHIYLSLLAVDPAFQGQGLGKLVLEEELKKADERKLDVYLESSNGRNLSFYHRLGFEQNQPVLKEGTASLTPMIRKPNPVGFTTIDTPRMVETQQLKSNTGGMNSSGLTCVDPSSITEKESKTSSVVGSTVDTVKSAVKNVGSSVSSGVSSGVSAVSSGVSAVSSGLSSGVSALDNKTNIVTSVKNMGSNLSNSMSSLGSSVSNSMSSLSQSISSSVSGSSSSSSSSESSSSSSGVSGVIGGMKQGISNVVSGIGSGISNVGSGVSGIASGVPPTTSGSARQGMDLSGISSSGSSLSSGGSSKGGILSGLFSGSSGAQSSGFNSNITHPGGRNYPELSTSNPTMDRRVDSVSGSGSSMSSSGSGLTRRTGASIPSAAS